MSSTTTKLSLITAAVFAGLYILISASVGVKLEDDIKYQLALLGQSLQLDPYAIDLQYDRGLLTSHALLTIWFDNGQVLISDINLKHNPHISHNTLNLTSIKMLTNINDITINSQHDILLNQTVDSVFIEPFHYHEYGESVNVPGTTTLQGRSNESFMEFNAETERVHINSLVDIIYPRFSIKDSFIDQTMHINGSIERILFEDDIFSNIKLDAQQKPQYESFQLVSDYVHADEPQSPYELSIKANSFIQPDSTQYSSEFTLENKASSEISTLILESSSPTNLMSNIVDSTLQIQLDLHETHRSLLIAQLPYTYRQIADELLIPNSTGYSLSIAYENYHLTINGETQDISEWLPAFNNWETDDEIPNYQIQNWS